ncbi:heparinase II/III domain-containing protein [Botryobacter ruber]|uniref:heparinase II/III domain-containing protein n=1 Tax=Botryobacter ruber TaxID=2171629 RepID=UPI000E0B1897|nr:heparinase II/III family protein [Botryobacter ruber]
MKTSSRFTTTLTLLITCIFTFHVSAQDIKIPAKYTAAHPRILGTEASDRAAVNKLLDSEAWAQQVYEQTKAKINPYVNRHVKDPKWIVSRLQMYWNSHATDVFIKGGVYAHATGKAPVPTPRFTGTRDATTPYKRPKLNDIKPYMDDERGLYLQNGTKEGNPWEWAEQSKTGRIVEAINCEIMELAENAAFMHWYTGEEKYARFAYDLFDTYMTGMYYRKEPFDLARGHHQTLVGLSSFEVIHEDILNELTATYDFLHDYILTKAPSKQTVYDEAFKKWADIIIQNGVPHNNWNLMQADFVAHIALVLQDNNAYKDGKGTQFYLDQILNRTTLRQWALTDLVNKGFDANTGFWNESPSYSTMVVNDFSKFVTLFDRTLNFDLLPSLPIVPKAVTATAQYLWPNGYMVGFGDTKYVGLPTAGMQQLILNAQKHQKKEQEEQFTRMYKMVAGESSKGGAGKPQGSSYKLLFNTAPMHLNATIPAGKLEEFLTPTFHAPNVSYFVQRNGLDPQHGLMISQAGSMGNHAHANGIAMELYGKGLVLAPEMGIGTSYFQPDYAEYYSQFPAHNTVVVDGISAYPVMKSNHSFEVRAAYPAPGQKTGYFSGVTFSDLYFREPETNADQNRLMSIVRTSEITGYYIDIFRSRKKEGGDKRHDYFYHNLGQELTLADAAGKPLPLQPTRKLAFADGDMFAYDYLWNKQSVKLEQDYQATYKLNIPGKDEVLMNMWMKGAPEREIFAVKAPPSKSFGTGGMVPAEIADLPLHTIVARQTGEAWNRPFVAVYEPSTSREPKYIAAITSFVPQGVGADFVGLTVESKNNSREYIFSAVDATKPIVHADMRFTGTYGIISENSEGLRYLFLGKGNRIGKEGWSLESKEATAAALSKENDAWYITADTPVALTVPATIASAKKGLKLTVDGKAQTVKGRNVKVDGRKAVFFELPALPSTKMEVL